MPTIHPTAIIGDQVTLADDVSIGPYCLLDGKISVGAGCSLKANVHFFGTVEVGSNNTFHSNSVIGDAPQDLGYTPDIVSQVVIGSGNIFRENVTVHRGAAEGGVTRVGDHNFLMAGSHLGHDVTVGDHSILANNTLLGGHATVGDRVFLGGGTVVHQFVKIGSLAMTQGNSGLSKDLPPYCISHGINILSGLNAIGMRRSGLDVEQRKEIKHLFFLLFQSGKNLTEAIAEANKEQWSPRAQLLLTAVSAPSKKGVMTR